MTDFEVKYFTDLTVTLNTAIVGLMSLHATVLLAAAGWAISNRSQPRGVHIWLLPFVVIGLGTFFAINVFSLQGLYSKFNAGISIIKKHWENKPGFADAGVIFQPVGTLGQTPLDFVKSWQFAIIVVDVVGIAFIALAMSNFGRKAPANAPPAKS